MKLRGGSDVKSGYYIRSSAELRQNATAIIAVFCRNRALHRRANTCNMDLNVLACPLQYIRMQTERARPRRKFTKMDWKRKGVFP